MLVDNAVEAHIFFGKRGKILDCSEVVSEVGGIGGLNAAEYLLFSFHAENSSFHYLNKKTVEDIDVSGKRVLVRCDFNVPFDAEGNITDTKRIDEAMKTINYLVKNNAKVVLCSHLGRPKGEFNMKYSFDLISP